MTLDELLRDTTDRLSAAGAHSESLGVFKPSRGVAIFRTADSFTPAGRAWRLGILLLDADARLFLVGEVTRAVEPGRAAVNRSPLGEERRAYRMAASRSAFPAGESINFDFTPIDVSDDAVRAGTGPLFLDKDRVMLRVDPASGGATDLERYLTERADLLLGAD